jgi:hypothetical protein
MVAWLASVRQDIDDDHCVFFGDIVHARFSHSEDWLKVRGGGYLPIYEAGGDFEQFRELTIPKVDQSRLNGEKQALAIRSPHYRSTRLFGSEADGFS